MAHESTREARAGLACRGLSARHGSLVVCRDIEIAVKPGEIMALIGPNGAGKTSLVGAINGTVASAGEIQLAGLSLARQPAHMRSRMGLATVPDNRGLFPTLSVAENMRLGVNLVLKAERQNAIEAAVERFPVIRQRWSTLAGALSGGEQQMLAIAKALTSRPKALLLDEPSQGLAPLIVDELARVLERLRNEGLPILLVEQNHGLVQRIADRFLILVGGRAQLEGVPADLDDRERIANVFLSRAGEGGIQL